MGKEIEELIVEARFYESPGHVAAYAEGTLELLRKLADALEAATRVPVQGEPNDPTAAQVEAAANALQATWNPWIAAYGDWDAVGFQCKQAFRVSARAALVAAAGAGKEKNDE